MRRISGKIRLSGAGRNEMIRQGVSLLAGMLFLWGCIAENEPEAAGYVSVGSRLPAFPAMTEVEAVAADPLDLQVFDPSDLGGKKTLIYFLWSQCGDCHEEMPHVLGVWDAVRERDDVRLVCIARGDKPGESRATLQMAVDYWNATAGSPPRSMPPLFYDAGRRVFDRFASQGVPRFYLADPAGIVRWEAVGSFSTASLLERIGD